MIQFFMLFSGQLRKHTKLFGIPYLTMIDPSDNGLSRIWYFIKIDNVWYVKGLIVTRSNLVLTRKVRPKMEMISEVLFFVLFRSMYLFFSICN